MKTADDLLSELPRLPGFCPWRKTKDDWGTNGTDWEKSKLIGFRWKLFPEGSRFEFVIAFDTWPREIHGTGADNGRVGYTGKKWPPHLPSPLDNYTIWCWRRKL